MDISPNNTGQASSPGNNPQLAPLLGLPDGWDLNLGAISEMANIGNEGAGYIATPQGPINMLMETRHKFPYLAIRPWPQYVKTVILQAGKPLEFDIPTGLVVCSFKGSTSYFISSQGNAQLPVQGDGNGTNSIFMPDNIVFYCGNIRHLSVISPTDGCVVTLFGHSFEELPRY